MRTILVVFACFTHHALGRMNEDMIDDLNKKNAIAALLFAVNPSPSSTHHSTRYQVPIMQHLSRGPLRATTGFSRQPPVIAKASNDDLPFNQRGELTNPASYNLVSAQGFVSYMTQKAATQIENMFPAMTAAHFDLSAELQYAETRNLTELRLPERFVMSLAFPAEQDRKAAFGAIKNSEYSKSLGKVHGDKCNALFLDFALAIPKFDSAIPKFTWTLNLRWQDSDAEDSDFQSVQLHEGGNMLFSVADWWSAFRSGKHIADYMESFARDHVFNYVFPSFGFKVFVPSEYGLDMSPDAGAPDQFDVSRQHSLDLRSLFSMETSVHYRIKRVDFASITNEPTDPSDTLFDKHNECTFKLTPRSPAVSKEILKIVGARVASVWPGETALSLSENYGGSNPKIQKLFEKERVRSIVVTVPATGRYKGPSNPKRWQWELTVFSDPLIAITSEEATRCRHRDSLFKKSFDPVAQLTTEECWPMAMDAPLKQVVNKKFMDEAEDLAQQKFQAVFGQVDFGEGPLLEKMRPSGLAKTKPPQVTRKDDDGIWFELMYDVREAEMVDQVEKRMDVWLDTTRQVYIDYLNPLKTDPITFAWNLPHLPMALETATRSAITRDDKWERNFGRDLEKTPQLISVTVEIYIDYRGEFNAYDATQEGKVDADYPWKVSANYLCAFPVEDSIAGSTAEEGRQAKLWTPFTVRSIDHIEVNYEKFLAAGSPSEPIRVRMQQNPWRMLAKSWQRRKRELTSKLKALSSALQAGAHVQF